MGSSRYDTAFQAANYMKTVKGIDQFDTVVVAYGGDFADALSGSYLAAVAEAPILLVHPKYEGDVLKYIGHNVKPEGKVYLLGGTSVVSEAFEQQLKNASFDVKRLGGADRFETNLLILEEGNALGGDASEVLVASATRFADALSTSSVGKPILLAGAKLTADQQDYLREAQPKNAWIVGGTSAVNATVEADLKNFVADGGIKRFEGDNRYETSYMVAHEFFPGECETAVLVYGQNFPDGLYEIKGWSFAHTAIPEAKLPDSLKKLGYGTFYGCNKLTEVILSPDVVKLDENTFSNCVRLKSVTIPSPDITIDVAAFDEGKSVVIIGVSGSMAEKYAKAMGLGFEAYEGQ